MVPQCGDDQLGQSTVKDSADKLSKRNISTGSFSNSDRPKCCRRKIGSSGYFFSLTWIKNSFGDGELMYRVLSLGTFKRIVPEWMKEVLMFSTKMCPVFFERVSRVVKFHPCRTVSFIQFPGTQLSV